MVAAKDDWQSDLRKWTASRLTDPNCKIRYTTGIYRPDLGAQPAWGFMTVNMFKWFSKDGVNLAPSVCPVTQATQNEAQYRILFSVSPVKTVSQTTHGTETHQVSEPFSAQICATQGGCVGSVYGQQTSTVIVPTETTISRSSVALYMYTYRANGNQLELISTDNVVFSRVAASGSGNNATGAELGAGIGNLIRASQDRHRADKLYEEALRSILADAAHPAVQNTKQMPEEDSAKLRHQAETGDGAAQVKLCAESYETGSSGDTDAAQWCRKAAEQGYPKAQTILGILYGSGQGVQKDDVEAALWFRKAAEQGDAGGQGFLGVMFANGAGVTKDETEAVRWYRKAAEQGNSGAEYNLGNSYAIGQGVEKDDIEAARWFRKSAEQGLAQAQLNLGIMYASGRGVPQNNPEAVRWWRNAAEQGESHAQYLLGLAYANGGGVPKDEAEAYFWLNLGASALDDSARSARDTVGANLTPEKRLEIQGRCREWVKTNPPSRIGP
jgi:TPR repeat protein